MAPTARILDVGAPALVLGSTQSVAMVAPGASIEVVCRRSGGGAVLVEPGSVLWVDVLLPAGDALWDDDVGRATYWLGRLWAAALADLGFDTRWHDGALVAGPWSHLACLGGLGPGEVTVDGRKVVGISQRRTRAGALFQCAALLAWDPSALVSLFRLSPEERESAVEQLRSAAGALAVEKAALEEVLLKRLAKH